MPNLCPDPEQLKKREIEVEEEVKKFVQKPEKLIKSISTEDLIDKGGINPYLVKALGLKNIEEAVEFFLMRRVERSLGTSFGTVLEKFIISILGCKTGKKGPECRGRGTDKPWYCWWDVILEETIEDNGTTYNGIVMAVKSGPANMDKDQVEHFAERARDAEERGYRPYLVLVYGKKAWNVITTTLINQGLPPEKYLRVGKEIFEEFMLDPDYYKRALQLFSSVGLEEDLFKLIDAKKKELVKELNETYGDGIDKLLEETLKGED
jgi:hypothetical protein